MSNATGQSNLVLKGLGMSCSIPSRNVHGSINVNAFQWVALFIGGCFGCYIIAKGVQVVAESCNILKRTHSACSTDMGSNVLPKEDTSTPKIELKDIGDIRDIKVDSDLIGHSGGLVVINGVASSGKTILAIQLMEEACSGKSSDLIPGTEGITGPKYKAIYYHAERDNHFQTNYGKYLASLGCNFKGAEDFPAMTDYKRALEQISSDVLGANDNVVVGIDNISAMIPSLTEKRNDVKPFIEGLKNIRREAEKRGHHVVFLLVTHSNKQGMSKGSSDWHNLAETFINVDKAEDPISPYYRTIECGKRRGLTPFKVEAESVKTDRLHFIKRQAAENIFPFATASPSESVPAGSNQSASIPEDSPAPNITPRKPIDAAAAALFYVEKKSLSFTEIFNKYKDEYELRDRNTVRNKINQLPRLLKLEFSEDQILNIWFNADEQKMTPKKALEVLGPRYGITDINKITYLIENGAEVGEQIKG